MEWLIAVGFLVLGVGQYLNHRSLKKLHIQAKYIQDQLNQFRVRQGQIKTQNVSRKNPEVTRARTVARDSDDLPATARISTGIHRKKREYDGQPRNS